MEKDKFSPDNFADEQPEADSTVLTNDNQIISEASRFFMKNLEISAEPELTMENLSNQMLKLIEEQQTNSSPTISLKLNQLLAEYEARTRQKSLVDDGTDQLIAKLDDANWEVRGRAAGMLGQKGDKRAIEPLIHALNDPALGVRYQAIGALGSIKDARVVKPLIATLEDPDLNNTFAAQNSLRQMGAVAVDGLIEALSHADTGVRWTVISLLGDIRDARALPVLILVQQNDTDVDPIHGAIKDVAARAIRSINRGQKKGTAEPLEVADSQDDPFGWKKLLHEWSIDLLASNYLEEAPTQEAIDAQWLGYPAATEEQILQAEARLGTKFPPSYRAFLKMTNGWGQTTNFIYKLWSTEELEWVNVRREGWVDGWNTNPEPVPDEEYFVYGEEQSCLTMRVEYLKTALEISDWGDVALYLLNPQVVTPEGEWEAWFFANWLPGANRYPSFWEMMQAEYESFHKLEGY